MNSSRRTFFFAQRGGWYGIRAFGSYWVWRDEIRHRLMFSERGRHGCSRLLKIGHWSLWRKA